MIRINFNKQGILVNQISKNIKFLSKLHKQK